MARFLTEMARFSGKTACFCFKMARKNGKTARFFKKALSFALKLRGFSPKSRDFMKI